MKRLQRILALLLALIILPSMNIFATQAESSDLISVQLQSIAESKGRETAQAMALSTLTVFLPQEAAIAPASAPFVAVDSAKSEKKTMEVSAGSIAAFTIVAVVLLLLIYLALMRNKKKRESYLIKVAPSGGHTKRLSLD